MNSRSNNASKILNEYSFGTQKFCPCLKDYVSTILPSERKSKDLFIKDKNSNDIINFIYKGQSTPKCVENFLRNYISPPESIRYQFKDSEESKILIKLMDSMHYRYNIDKMVQEALFFYKDFTCDQLLQAIEAYDYKLKKKIPRELRYYILKTWLLKNYKNPYPEY